MAENSYKELKKKEIASIYLSDEYKRYVNSALSIITDKGNSANNEAEIEFEFDYQIRNIFDNLFSHLGYTYDPEKESAVDTCLHKSKGRADSSVGGLIVEFKHRSKLATKKLQRDAIEQAKTYLEGFNASGNEKIFALITDGLKAGFLMNTHKKSVDEIGEFPGFLGFEPLNTKILDKFIKAHIGLTQTQLNAGNLVKDLANSIDGRMPLSMELSHSLYEIMTANPSQKTEMLYDEWKELFKLSHNDQSQQRAIVNRREALSKYFSRPINNMDNEYRALFVLQTSYAICVKLIAFKVTSLVSFRTGLIDFDDLRNMDSTQMLSVFKRLEDGEIFRDYGINNLLEGDFFSWYANDNQWDSSIHNSISNIALKLLKYIHTNIFSIESNAHDFFKDLYMSMIPREVRHSLGEYYTPQWLAEKIIDESLKLYGKKEWTGLDPTCGSGTFITILINKIRRISKKKGKELLEEITSKIVGIDINPVTVLTARVNYYLNISDLVEIGQSIEIPIYLGDSAYVPETVSVDGVECLQYEISTIITSISILVPKSLTSNISKFSQVMTSLESDILANDSDSIYLKLLNLVAEQDRVDRIQKALKSLSDKLVIMEQESWNGIWARVIANYLITGSIGKFDIIVGNPPWVDWKSLPSGYRERIKSLNLTSSIFSGDGMTGGINLNVCALITYVVAINWLSEDGIFSFLMPDTLMFQKSYEGFRNLKLSDDRRLYISEIYDWTKSGNPFHPVTQTFFSYFMSFDEVDYSSGIKKNTFVKKEKRNSKVEQLDFDDVFDTQVSYLYQSSKQKTYFTSVRDKDQIKDFNLIAGESDYLGREGIEVYPQELMIFKVNPKIPMQDDKIGLINIQNTKSKFKVPAATRLFEKKYLVPLVKGVMIRKFRTPKSDLLVPFVYDSDYSTRVALPLNDIIKSAPCTGKFFKENKALFEAQNEYSNKLIHTNKKNPKPSTYYSLARVGKYSFGSNFVVFRDNSKWCACVVTELATPWGDKKRPIFQNHAVSISQRSDGEYISNDEAHYICAIMNSPTVEAYVVNSSDSRTFPIRPRFKIPEFDVNNKNHSKLSSLSKKAHTLGDDAYDKKVLEILDEIDEVYISLL